MYSNCVRISLILISSIFLISCASTQRAKIGHVAWKQHAASITKIKNWHMTGRIAFNDSKEGANANFIWQQFGDGFKLEVFGPFGAERVTIFGTPNKVTLISHDGTKSTARTPEQLLNKKLGWHIPISGLQYWIMGIPEPDIKITKYTLNKEGLLKTLSQQSWVANYFEYQILSGEILPGKITLNNHNLKVKVAIRSWKKI
jgi:outer membrane lipoprotein LolB